MALSTIPFSALSSDASKQGVNFRNLIINGDMSIAQRGTSSSSITSGGYYTVDRMEHAINYGTWTLSQSTDVPTGQGFAKSAKWDCTATGTPTASQELKFRQKIEGQFLQHLKKGTSNAESMTLSFWVKSTKTGTYIVEMRDDDNNRNICQSYTISASNTWEKKTLTFAGDTTGAYSNDNGQSLQCTFWLGAGSNYTSGTLATSWESTTNANRAVGQVNLADSTANEWYITGVQLEVGTSASDFEFLPYDVNLQRCFRYYEKDTTEYRFSLQTNADFGAKTGHLQWKATKRATPSLTADPDAGNVNLTRRTIWGCGLTLGGAVSSSSNLPNGYIADSEL